MKQQMLPAEAILKPAVQSLRVQGKVVDTLNGKRSKGLCDFLFLYTLHLRRRRSTG